LADLRNQKRLKISSPTFRERERYVSFSVRSQEPVSYSDLEAAIWNTLLEFYGEFGVGNMSIWMVKNTWDPEVQSGVIKCNNLSVPKLIACLGLISRLGESRIVLKVESISGTIRGLEKRA
jgi:RNase P/RNase MRP subunit POP5